MLICKDIQHNWNIAIKKFRRGMKAYGSKSFGCGISLRKERVQRCKAAYIYFNVIPTLVKSIFGKDYSRVPRENIIEYSKNCTIMYVHSAERINYILTLAGENPCALTKQDKTFQLCRKVNYKERSEEKTSYVLHETNTHLQVLKLDNTLYNIPKLKYCEEIMQYQPNGEWLCYDLQHESDIVEDENGKKSNYSILGVVIQLN